jgi:hypothetical protein
MARPRIPDADGMAAVRACTTPVGPDQLDRPAEPSVADQIGQTGQPVQADLLDRPDQPDQPDHPDRRPDRATQRLAVRYTLQLLTDRAPGHSVEVRIPPFAAVQAIPGPVHRRGTPSAVVEMDAPTWLALATGELSWAQAKAAGQIRASGERADLTGWLPLVAD